MGSTRRDFSSKFPRGWGGGGGQNEENKKMSVWWGQPTTSLEVKTIHKRKVLACNVFPLRNVMHKWMIKRRERTVVTKLLITEHQQ